MTTDDFDKINKKSKYGPLDESNEELAERIQNLEAGILEERFLWIRAFLLIFDLFFFQNYETWGSPIGILILEVIFLIVLARKFGVSDITRLTDKLLSAFGRNNTQ